MIFKYNKDTNNITGILTWIKSLKRVEIDIDSLIPQFNAMQKSMLDNGYSAALAAERIGSVDKSVVSYCSTAKAGELTQEGFVKSLNRTTLAAKAGQIALKGLAIAGNMITFALIGKGIQLVTEAINNHIHRNEIAIEKADELKSSLSASISSINDKEKSLKNLSERFTELSKGVDEYGNVVALTSDESKEYKNIVEELIGLNPSIVKGYNAEGEAIINKNSALQDTVELLKQEKQLELEKVTSSDNLKTIAEGAFAKKSELLGNEHIGQFDDFDLKTVSGQAGRFGQEAAKLFNDTTVKAFYDYTNSRPSEKMYGKNSWMKVFGLPTDGKDIDLEEYLMLNIDTFASNMDDILQKANIDPNSEQARNLKLYVQEWQSLNKELDSIDSSYIDEYTQKIPQLVSGYNDLSDAQKNFISDFIRGSFSAYDLKENSVNVKSSIINMVESISNNSHIKSLIDNLFSLKDENISVEVYVQQYKKLIEQILSKLNLNDTEKNSLRLKLNVQIDDTDKIINNVKGKLQDKFDNKVGELSLDDVKIASEQIEVSDGVLLTWDELIAKIKEVKKANDEDASPSFTDAITQIQALSKGLDQLDKIYLDIKDKKDFDWSSILNNEAFTEEFGNMENATEAYKNTYEEFIQTVSNSPTDIKACQSAFDNLATAYIYNSGALQDVTDETKAATVAMLKQMGVANADAVVTAALTAKQLYLKLNLDDSTQSIYAQVSGLLEHSNASDIAKASLFNLIAEEQIFSNTNLDTAGKIAQLEQLGLAFGITADAAHSSASAIEAIRFAGRAGGKDAAARTEKEIYEQNSSWYRDQISKKYASISVNYKAPGGSGKTGKGKSGKGSGSSSKQEYKETIDWAEKTITLLTNKINLLNAKLENTTSYKNQIKYIKKLADAQENLIQVYDKVESARSKTYKASLKKLSKTDRKKVESGAYTVENIKWVKSSDSKGTAKNEKRYQNIKDALEARDSLAKTQQDSTKAKTQLKKLASDLADKIWEKATNSLEKYNHQMDLLEKKLSNTASFKSKNKLLAKQLDLEQKILSAKEKALSVEKQEAKSIGNKIKKGYKKLSSSKKEKIDKSLKSETKIDIASLGVSPSSSLYQLMIQYNAYVDKLVEETANLEIDKQEAISSINEKAQSIVDNVWDEAMAKVESLSNEIESLDKVLANTDGFKERNKILEEMIRLTEESIQAAKQGVQDEKKKTVVYDKNIKNELAKDKKRKKKKISSKDTKVIETAIKSGKKINAKELSSVKVDSDLYKNIIQHNKSIDATKEKRKIYQDNKQDGISDINQRILDKYSSIQDYYEQISNKIQSDADKLNGLISLAEAKGQVTSKTYYQKLQGFEKNKTKDLIKEKKDLEKQLESDIKSGRIEIYSSKWYEAIATIQDCEKAILDSELAMQELDNSIRELDWSKFDQLISKLEEISKESNFMIGLFDKDNLFDDNGVINLDGLTAQGLYAQNHNVYMEESKKYAEEIKKIDESLAKDPYNKTLLDRRNELLSAQQQAITNAKAEKDSIISLVEEGYKKKVDALSELVSKQQELLDKEKELHDYEKSIRDKSDNITMLEKQIQALSLSTDRSDIAKRLQLEEELKNSKEDLEEEQYQHSISSQKDALSNALNDYKEQIDDYLKDRDKVFEDALSEVNAYHSSILTNIENKAQSVGYKISDSLIHVWSNTNPVSNYANTVIDSMNGVGEALDNVITKLQDMYQYYEKIAKENINTTFKDSNDLTTSAKIRDILGEASGKNGASNKGTSELNKYLASLGYGYLDQDGMVKLAKALDIKGMDSIEGIRENGGTSVIVEELKKYISSNKDTVSELEKQGKVSASNVKKTMDLIHNASTYTDKRDKLSDLNKYIYDNYDKKYLTKSQMVKLAKYLGETSVKDTSDLTNKAKKNLLDKLKAASFSKGGIVEFVRQTGEDGISLVRRGEGILSQEQVEVFRKSIPIMNHVTQQLDINKSLVPVQRDVSNIVKITSPLVEVNGNLDNVTKKELENAIGNVPNMLVSQMNKYGSRGRNLRK